MVQGFRSRRLTCDWSAAVCMVKIIHLHMLILGLDERTASLHIRMHPQAPTPSQRAHVFIRAMPGVHEEILVNVQHTLSIGTPRHEHHSGRVDPFRHSHGDSRSASIDVGAALPPLILQRVTAETAVSASMVLYYSCAWWSSAHRGAYIYIYKGCPRHTRRGGFIHHAELLPHNTNEASSSGPQRLASYIHDLDDMASTLLCEPTSSLLACLRLSPASYIYNYNPLATPVTPFQGGTRI